MSGWADYRFSPDVLDLLIKNNNDGRLAIRSLNTDFGEDDRLLVYYDNALLGSQGRLSAYAQLQLGSDWVVVNLLPTLKRQIPSLHPSGFQDFEIAMRSLLNNETVAFYFHCEKDCDQNPIPSLDFDAPTTKLTLTQMFDYCKGKQFECPTFSITRLV